MPILNFPHAVLKFKVVEGITQVFDVVRKKYIKLTPEEWVRQHIIHFLHFSKGYPLGLMMIEKKITYNGLTKRADIVACDKKGDPTVIVECKSPDIEISQDVFFQIAQYNFCLKAPYLFLSNGFKHIFCRVDFDSGGVNILQDLPNFNSIYSV